MDDLYFPPIARFRFRVRALQPIELPPYTGSTWRGLLATALRDSVCVPRIPNCAPCLVTLFCAFHRFFEQGEGDQDPRFRHASAPFVLDLPLDGPRQLAPGETMMVGVTFIGDSIDFVPFWVYAFRRAGVLGLGRGRGHNQGRFELIGVEHERLLGGDLWHPVWDQETAALQPYELEPVPFGDPPCHPEVTLRTPLRIRREGDFVTAQGFSAAEFLYQLCTRLDRLEQQFGGGASPGFWERHRDLIRSLPPSEADVRWVDWTRYSSRQRQYMKLGGLVGRFPLPEAAVTELWPLVWLGQWVHLGKNTSFGLGSYRVCEDRGIHGPRSHG